VALGRRRGAAARDRAAGRAGLRRAPAPTDALRQSGGGGVISRVFLLALVLAGLVAWDRALIERDADTRTRATETVGRVLDQAALEALDFAAVRLEFGDGRPALTFVPLQGMWRCMEAFQAPVDVAALDGLIGAITSAEGYVQSEDPEQAASYGIGASDGVRFLVCGQDVLSDPAHDVQWGCDLGATRPSGEGSFLRPLGSSEVWAVDKAPREMLDAATHPGIPALVDPTIVGKGWIAAARGIGRVFVDRADGSFFELATRPREVTEEEMRAGIPPYEWVFDLATNPEPLPMGRALAYVFHLQSSEHVGVLDPRQAQALGYGGPDVDQVTIFPPDPPPGQQAAAQPLVLHFLPPLSGGDVPVVNPAANAVYRLPKATAEMILASREALADPSAPNPWDAALKAKEGH